MISLSRIRTALRLPALRSGEDGAVIAEALIAVPFVTLFAVGILEFGNIFWQRMQIENGLRDAARYMARCRPSSATYTAVCSDSIARDLAFYGSPAPATGTPLRVPGWGPAAADITISGPTVIDPDCPTPAGTIALCTSHQYLSSPLFGWLGISTIKISSEQQERYNGW